MANPGGMAMTIKLRCRYCKIQFKCESFEQVAMIQNEQCYITRVGVSHALVGVKE